MVSIGRQALDEAKKLLKRRKQPTGYEVTDEFFAEQRRRWGFSEQREVSPGVRGEVLPKSVSQD